jgi:hypothetical protein
MGSQAVCGAVRAHDPTTAAIAAQISDRDQLRAKADRLVKIDVVTFEKGYAQAVQEIHTYFAKSGQHGVAHEIDVHFGKRGVS